MTGHATGDRVDREGHFRAILLEQIAELTDDMLSLGHGHAVARDEHDRLRCLENEVCIVGDDRLDLALDLGCLLGRAEAGEQHVGQGPVHRLAHDVREDDAGGTNQRTGDNEQVVVDGEARSAGREARVAVQQRDDDGHVSAADRDDRHDAEQHREPEQDPEVLTADHGLLHEHVSREHDPDEDRAVHDPLAGEHDRGRVHDLGQFAVRDKGAGGCHAADQNRQDDGDEHEAGRLDAHRRCERTPDKRTHLEAELVIQRGPTHEQRRRTTGTVEERDHLRHGRHCDHARRSRTDQRAEQHGDDDVLVADDLPRQERRHHCEQHADGRQHVAAAGRIGMAQHLQAENEERRRRDVGEVDQIRGELHAEPPLSLLLNMPSIRSVTM